MVWRGSLERLIALTLLDNEWLIHEKIIDNG